MHTPQTHTTCIKWEKVREEKDGKLQAGNLYDFILFTALAIQEPIEWAQDSYAFPHDRPTDQGHRTTVVIRIQKLRHPIGQALCVDEFDSTKNA